MKLFLFPILTIFLFFTGNTMDNELKSKFNEKESGEVLDLRSSNMPVNINYNSPGSMDGVEINKGKTGGLQAGAEGRVLNNISIPVDSETFIHSPNVTVFKFNDIDCINDKSQLIATGALQYSWSPASSLNDPNIPNPIASPIVTTVYTVTGTDINGATSTATITVNVDFQFPGGYFVPNAFTPNNDGLNDCLRLKYWGVILEFEFHIYNRWGQQVFYSTDISKCWDGTLKGVEQNPGTFYYLINAKTTCSNKVFRRGFIILIR